MTKRLFNAKGRRAQELLELVHTDVCGPMSTQAKGYFGHQTRDMENVLQWSHEPIWEWNMSTLDHA